MNAIRYKDIKVLPVYDDNEFIKQGTLCEYLGIKQSTLTNALKKYSKGMGVISDKGEINIGCLKNILPKIKPKTANGQKLKTQFIELSKISSEQREKLLFRIEGKPNNYYEFSGVKLEINNGKKTLTAGAEIEKGELVSLDNNGFAVPIGRIQHLPSEEILKLHKKIEDQQFEMKRLGKIIDFKDAEIRTRSKLEDEIQKERGQLLTSIDILKADLKTKEEQMALQASFLQLTKSQKENLERQFRERTDKFKLKYNVLKDLIKEIIANAR